MTESDRDPAMPEGRLWEFAEKCAARNAVVNACLAHGEMSLDEFLERQAEKVRKNLAVCPLRNPADFIEASVSLTEKRLGKAAAADVRDALRCGVILTADHHGGIYCAQTFQGDILYAELLRRLGYAGRHIPILGGAQVELGNVTFARGICVYTEADGKNFLPMFGGKYRNMIALRAPSLTKNEIDRFRFECIRLVSAPRMRDALNAICSDVYETDEVLSAPDYCSQITQLGVRLSEPLFPEDGSPVFTYLEIEEAILPILIGELREEGSLLRHLLSDPAARAQFASVKTGEGAPLISYLFGATDEKGRKVFLQPDEDGFLSGTTMDGGRLCFPFEPDAVSDLLEQRVLFPLLYAAVFLLTFERGITMTGGMFQALYLPDWHRCTVALLEKLALSETAERIRNLDCSGYLCGPMSALCACGDYAVPAGPAEMWMLGTGFPEIRRLISATGLWNAHLVGLAEMYYDLFHKNEREENWYRTIGESLYRNCRRNILYDESA